MFGCDIYERTGADQNTLSLTLFSVLAAKHTQYPTMAWKPSQLMLNPVQEQSRELVNIVERPQQSRKPTLSRELQIGGSSSQFNLPDGWIVEERPRRYNPTHVDRVYLSSSSLIYHCLFMHACILYHSYLLTSISVVTAKFCIYSNHHI